MADEFRINEAEFDNLIRSPRGPVMSELRQLGKTVERGARRRAKGPIAAGVKSKGPAVDAEGPHVDIETGAEDEHGAPIGLFGEVGTKPHVIEARNKEALFWPGAAHPVKKVNHPGTQAKPHLRPALYEDIS